MSAVIRIYGDPVLREATKPIDEIDGRVAALSDQMIETMREANGAGLAANQIGIQRRLFVFDIGEGPKTVVNPEIVESDGEWVYNEGCLSVPGLHWEIVRPNRVHLVGLDLTGNEISWEVDEMQGRVFQHEIDHLNGVLLLERLEPEVRKEAIRTLRERALAD